MLTRRSLVRIIRIVKVKYQLLRKLFIFIFTMPHFFWCSWWGLNMLNLVWTLRSELDLTWPSWRPPDRWSRTLSLTTVLCACACAQSIPPCQLDQSNICNDKEDRVTGLKHYNFFMRKSWQKIKLYIFSKPNYIWWPFLLIFFRNQEERLLWVSKNFEPNVFNKSNCQIIN